ncbi:MAG: FAD-dependent oxidoreductase, partial [Acidimicrobiales bacterium]|nr:FAD-dependent oxidoreductase [Acidimicrobiales bacterium]
MRSCEVVVIGGGIAGVSAAARLAEQGASVVLVEAEATLAFHTTGRSAAQYLENYGNDEVR